MQGIGTEQSATAPVLTFIKSGGKVSHNAMAAEAAKLENKLSVSPASSTILSSFAGGSNYELIGEGLTQDVLQGNAEVIICEKPCKIKPALSNADKFTCGTPAIATLASNENFAITPEQSLRGKEKIFAGMSEEEANRAFDDVPLPGITGSRANCYIGVQFDSGFVGVLNELSIFLDYFDTNLIVDRLVFQGSNDGFESQMDDLMYVGEEAHEGWNNYDLSKLDNGIP